MESITGLARENHVDLKVLNAAREVNLNLADRLCRKWPRARHRAEQGRRHSGAGVQAEHQFSGGIGFLQLAQNLLAGGARVRAYDPVAIPDARLQLNGMVKYCESAYGVAREWMP
jgi:UDP-glucose 6-dehydrogenase